MFVLLALIALLLLFVLLIVIQILTPTTSITLFALLSSLTLLSSIIILLIFYSNKDDEEDINDIPLGKTKEGVMVYYVTEKRQCVEFVRRYLTVTKGLTFPSVKDANELFNLTSVHDVKNNSKIYLTSFYKKPNIPREGDIIFMNISKWGHVGVVVNVSKNNDDVILDIISQNSKDQKWYHSNDGNYGYTERMSLSDPLILGWWRVGEKMENFEYPTTASS